MLCGDSQRPRLRCFYSNLQFTAEIINAVRKEDARPGQRGRHRFPQFFRGSYLCFRLRSGVKRVEEKKEHEGVMKSDVRHGCVSSLLSGMLWDGVQRQKG